MSSEVVEETSDGTVVEEGTWVEEGTVAEEAKEPNQCSSCFMSRETFDMVA